MRIFDLDNEKNNLYVNYDNEIELYIIKKFEWINSKI